MKKKIIYICLLVIAILWGGFYFIQNFYFVSKAALSVPDIPKLIVYDNETVTAFEEDEEAVKILGENNEIYVPLDLLKEGFDIHTDYDSANKVGTVTTNDKVIRFYQGSGKMKINDATVGTVSVMILEGDRPYVPIKAIEVYLGLRSRWIEGRNTVILTNLKEDLHIGEVIKDQSRVRKEGKLMSPVIDILERGEKVQSVSENGEWMMVITESGQVGYVDGGAVGKLGTEKGVGVSQNKPIWKPENGKIFLTWEHVHSKNPDPLKIGPMEGVNVISPTWISVVDGKGVIKHKIDRDYIRWAKEQGYKVWALANNSFDPDMTSTILNNALTREKIIKELKNLAVTYDLDGINIDFENVYLKDRDNLTQFMRELTPILHEKGIVVSMDVTVKSTAENWSLCYDREALGEIVDYMAVMTYDEHWSTSPVSGSVASIGWVERGMLGILEEVPAEKLLVGVPFYTRIWTESPAVDDSNKVVVKSRSVGMETVKTILENPAIQKEWIDEAGQYYVSYEKDGKIEKIWIEDGRSIQLKAALVGKYDFAGIAAWRRGFESQDIWDIINQTINLSK